jgi:hypothetical protein
MNRWIPPIVAALFFLAASAATASAQSEATQASQSVQPPLPAQTAPQNSPANPPASQTQQKKVWTNDEMNSLNPHAGVSTVGNSNAPSAVSGPKPKTTARTHDAKWYHDEIARLQAKIPPLDTQIAELQAAIAGKPTGDGVKSTRPSGVKFDNWTSELAALEKKRDDLLSQISTIQDQARHDGVAPSALP